MTDVAERDIEQDRRTPARASSGGGRWRLAVVAAIALAAVLGAVLLRDALTFEALSENRERLLAWRDANYAATVLAFLAAYAALVALSLPGATLATLTGGFLFGLFPGAPLNVAGATTGAVLLFLAVRWGAGARLAARLDASEGLVRRVKAGIDENQWSMLFLIRLVPAVPFFAANIIPAMLDVPLRRFAISTALGIVPGALVYTSVGAGLGEVLARGETPDLGIIFEPRILLPMLGLAALAALPIAIRAVRGRRGL